MRIRTKALFSAGAVLAFFLGVLPPAFAQTAPNDAAAVRLRGTIEKIDGQTLVFKADNGDASSFILAADAVITKNMPSSLSAIKPGDFVASAAVKGEDGKLHSTELRIFPAALRGVGEGQRPMREPNTMMTNAAVTEVAAAADGRVLKVKYKGGTSELIVGPDIAITALVPGDASLLKPGMTALVTATKASDGHMTAIRVAAD